MKVSVIIPYNRNRGYLGDAVKSCEYQIDFTLGEDYEIICEYGDCGVSKNLNNAIAKAKGKYIKLCGEDDLMPSNSLIDLYTYAEANQCDVTCANAINFYEDGTEILVISRIPQTVAEFAYENTMHGGSLLYLKSALLPWDETIWTAEEYELNLRMAAAGRKFGYVNKTVFKYRCHGSQKSGVYWQTDPEERLYRFEYIERLQDKFVRINKLINQ